MGLIKAVVAAGGSVLADQWKELFYTDSLDKDTLMVRGKKKTSGKSSNHGNDNIITNGSGLLVNDGQCAIIVDQGEIAEVCAEPGYYTYDQSTEPTIFNGDLGKGIKDSFERFKVRFTYGGDTGKDQRIYYFNTKEIIDNKFGTPNPIMYRVVDNSIGLDIDASLKCSGVYSFKIADPIIFYKNVVGNVTSEYTKEEIEEQLKAEFIQSLSPAISRLSTLELRPSELPGHVKELADYLNEDLSTLWGENRGLKVQNVAISTLTVPEDIQEEIRAAQKAKLNRTAGMAAAQTAAAYQDAMRGAATNEGGAAGAFVGMGMAQGMGGQATANLFEMAQNEQTTAGAAPTDAGAAAAGETPKFCPECGTKLAPGIKFCPECGKKLL